MISLGKTLYFGILIRSEDCTVGLDTPLLCKELYGACFAFLFKENVAGTHRGKQFKGSV